MIFTKQTSGEDAEKRRRALGPREHAGMQEHGEAERGATATSERFTDSPTPHVKSLKYQIALLLLLVGALAALAHESASAPSSSSIATTTQPSAVAAASEPAAAPTATSTKKAVVPLAGSVATKTPQQSQISTTIPGEMVASRVQDPYTIPPLDFADVNSATRTALVNIFCTPHGGGLHPISGSGVFIDPRGVILTNAHVAQYVLLSESPHINLECAVRTGSPASAHYTPKVLYIPSTWVSQHAADINSAHPIGTGEYDYALLTVVATTDGSPLPSSFPSVSPDTREVIAFVDDPVLAASYPAELAAGSVQMSLYPASSLTQINNLFTFGTGSVDVISVGGVIEAQGGSSGGAIVNAWGRLVGMITTTSDGTTTAARDLRGITTAYIDRDLALQTGGGLSTVLAGDIFKKTQEFSLNQAPVLLGTFLPYLGQQ